MAGWTFNIGPGSYATDGFEKDTPAINFGYNLGQAAVNQKVSVAKATSRRSLTSAPAPDAPKKVGGNTIYT